MLAGAPVDDAPIDDETIRDALRVEFAAGASTRDARPPWPAALGVSKREVYALAIALDRDGSVHPGPVPARTEPRRADDE